MNGIKIGVISDTHGLLRDEFLEELKNVDLIIHAGDMDKESVFYNLKDMDKPFVAVRGNCDKGVLKSALPKSDIIDVNGKYIYVVHNIDEIDIEPESSGIDVVIFGHSHKACEIQKNNILYLNPGGAGPKRFKLPISMAILTLDDNEFKVEFKYVR